MLGLSYNFFVCSTTTSCVQSFLYILWYFLFSMLGSYNFFVCSTTSFCVQSFLYILWYFLFSMLGNYNFFFFAAHLLDVAIGFKTLRTILQSVTHNGKQVCFCTSACVFNWVYGPLWNVAKQAWFCTSASFFLLFFLLFWDWTPLYRPLHKMVKQIHYSMYITVGKLAVFVLSVNRLPHCSAVGLFNEAGLHEWMSFVIFRARSCERSQCHFRTDFWVGVASCCV